MPGHAGYTVRQAAYDLRKMLGKRLVDKPGRSRRHHIQPEAMRTIAAPLTLRDPVIARSWPGPQPTHGPQTKDLDAADRDYEQIRINMHAPFGHLGLDTAA